MEFQKELQKMGTTTKQVGDQILDAAEKKNIAALGLLTKQLLEVVEGLNAIRVVDDMTRSIKPSS